LSAIHSPCRTEHAALPVLFFNGNFNDPATGIEAEKGETILVERKRMTVSLCCVEYLEYRWVILIGML
jgi:hypothetical protein